MRIEKHATLVPPMRHLVELLVEKKYDEIERMTGGQRLSSAELRQAVIDYGRILTIPPEDAWSRLDVVEVKASNRPTFSVRFDLWANGKRSDLSIEVTFVEISPDGEFQVEVDDLHVL